MASLDRVLFDAKYLATLLPDEVLAEEPTSSLT